MDEPLTVDDLRWKLSQINPNRPSRFSKPPEQLDAPSLLSQDVIELELIIEEWEGIAESYRELAQLAIEAAARQYALSQTLNKRLTDLLELQRSRR